MDINKGIHLCCPSFLQSGRPDLNRRLHGPEPGGLKPLPRTSRILDFANRVVSSGWVAVWTTAGF
jgi:hypothetical protein